MRFIPVVLSALLWLLTWAAFFALATLESQAGTYNFYFNNAEQGDNSTANPSVIVKDGDQEKDKTKTPSDEDVELNDSAEDVAPVSSSRRRAKMARSRPVLRLGVGYYRARATVMEQGNEKPLDQWEPGSFFTESPTEKTYAGVTLSASVFFNRFVGAGLFLGALYGGEMEVQPFGTFGRTVEFGILAGITSVGVPLIGADTAFHTGANLGINFDRTWGMTLVAKVSPFSDGDLSFLQGGAGLTARF